MARCLLLLPFILLLMLLAGCPSQGQAQEQTEVSSTQTYACPTGEIVGELSECPPPKADVPEITVPPLPFPPEEPEPEEAPCAGLTEQCVDLTGSSPDLRDCCSTYVCKVLENSPFGYCVEGTGQGCVGEGERCGSGSINTEQYPNCCEPFKCGYGDAYRYCVKVKECTVTEEGAYGCIRAGDIWIQEETCGFHENTEWVTYVCDSLGYVISQEP